MYFHIPGSEYTQSRSYYSVKYRIDSSGFRGPDIRTKSIGVKRAIVIGDSIVEGHGCEFNETFSYKIGKTAAPFNWEVLNLGVQGASPAYYAANISRYLATDPDAALIVLFENDLYDDRNQERSYFGKPLLDNPAQLIPGHSDERSIFEKSYLMTLMARSLREICFNEPERIIKGNLSIDTINIEQENLNKLSPWLVAQSMFDTQWRMSEKYLDFVTAMFSDRKIPVYVVYLSLGALVPGQNSQYRLHSYTLNGKIAEWSKRKGIPFLSLVPVVEELISRMPIDEIMIRDDGHPTPKAHTIFAEHIWQWLSGLNQ